MSARVLLDLNMPGVDGRKERPNMAVIHSVSRHDGRVRSTTKQSRITELP
jgi:hypothetical protein